MTTVTPSKPPGYYLDPKTIGAPRLITDSETGAAYQLTENDLMLEL